MKQEAIISPSNLKKDFSWILFGNLYYAATQYLLLIGITRFSAPSTVGKFSLALAITAPVSLFLSLSLRAVLISDSKNEYSSSNYLWTRILTSLISILVIAGIVFLNHYPMDVAYPILIVGLIKAIESMADLFYGFFQKKGKNHQISNSMCIRGTLSTFFGLWILYQTESLNSMCLGMITASFFTFIFYDVPRFRSIQFSSERNKVNWKEMKPLILLSLPLAFAIALSSLELNVPRYLIEHKIGLTSLGIFSALSYPLMLGNQIVGALASSASPHLAELFHGKSHHQFKKLILKLTLAGTLIGAATALGCALWGKPILSLLKHQEYIEDAPAFAILALAGGISYVTVFFGAGLSAMKCFKSKFILQILSFVAVSFFAWIASQDPSVHSMSIAILLGAIVSLVSQAFAFNFHLHHHEKN